MNRFIEDVKEEKKREPLVFFGYPSNEKKPNTFSQYAENYEAFAPFTISKDDVEKLANKDKEKE